MKKTLKEELEESFQRWDNELYSGGSDPYYSDGVNMNLLRNHIIAYKTQILETGELPEIYHRKIPEELPESFMVQAEKIYQMAIDIFRQCRDDADYQFLCGLELNPKMERMAEVINALKNVRELEGAIKKQDYVVMRRYYDKPDFKKCRLIVERSSEKIEPKIEQMSLFAGESR